MSKATIVPLRQECAPRITQLMNQVPWVATTVEGMSSSLEGLKSVGAFWTDAPIPFSPEDCMIPTKTEIQKSLWITEEGMKEVRAYTSYECFDLRVLLPREDGGVDLLTVQRGDPRTVNNPLIFNNTENPVEEGTPLNHCMSPLGGRITYAAPNSPLEGRWSEMQSAFLKLHEEAGITPDCVDSIWNLGYSRMSFPGIDGKRLLKYSGIYMVNEYTEEIMTRSVRLLNGQNAVIRNLVVVLRPEAAEVIEGKLQANATAHLIGWISNVEFKKPEFRRYFCEYEQAVMDSVYAGWEVMRGRIIPSATVANA